MNFFSSRVFASAVGRAYYPGKVLRFRTCRVGGRNWCLPQYGDGPPAAELPFLDFYEPVPDLAVSADNVPYLSRGCLEIIRADQWGDHQKQNTEPAPYIDWRHIGSFEAFERHIDAQSISLRSDGLRQTQKLASEVGELVFTYNDESPEAFEKVVEWKSQFCAARGVHDIFENPDNVNLFKELARVGVLRVPTLSAGGKLIAADFGIEFDRRYYAWIASYDPEYAPWSPGRILMEWEMSESCRLGHREFDMLLGDEEYKWNYASHARLVGPIGLKPLKLQVMHSLREGARRVKSKLRAS